LHVQVLTIIDIKRLWRAAWEVKHVGTRGMRAHLADQICPVRRPQRRHGENIVDGRVREPPIAPRNEARVVGFEAGAVKHPIVNSVALEEEDTSIPYRRPLPLQLGKITVDRRTVSDGELPQPRLNRYLNAFCYQSHAIYHYDRWPARYVG
jgi:hypothetical protein